MCPSPRECPFYATALPGSMAPSVDAKIASWQQAHLALHSQTWREVAATIRSYMVAVTAKDCGIMFALAPAPSATHASAEHKSPPNDDSAVLGCLTACPGCMADLKGVQRVLAESSCSSKHLQERSTGADEPHTCVGLVRHGGHVVHCRLGVVDFDQKPLTKIDQHMDLDKAILAAQQSSTCTGC